MLACRNTIGEFIAEAGRLAAQLVAGMIRSAGGHVPLYTFVMSFQGSTKAYQHRRSNFRGFLLEPIGTAFSELKSEFPNLMRMTLEPVPHIERTWRGSMQVWGEEFTLHVIETQG
jgi:hypothetical protein